MFRISKAEKLTGKTYLMDVEAPRVARACEPGEFVIVKMDETDERVPLITCGYDRGTEATTIVFRTVGASIRRMAELQVGDAFQDAMGPLDSPSKFVSEDIEVLKNKKMLFVTGGIGTASVYSQVRWPHEHGIDANVTVGVKNYDLLILEEQMRAMAGNLYITTDDGSYVCKGMVTEVIRDSVQEQRKQHDICVAIGSMIMMKFVCLLAKELNLPTIVSTNLIMMDETGMCGACRLTVGDEVKFACVDDPEFNGHLVNFDEVVKRQQMYKIQEGWAMLKLQEGDIRHGGCGHYGGDE